ncbi:EAL domain-containing protein [Marinobacter shengliensis]|uniref:EAL domain-containing protein n=1 Tax=Marinobacter shengliensis TaxID=1389223 RepID=UPI001107FE5A|nr:EAL domain-containing protein [Marinobacter shengliensis]
MQNSIEPINADERIAALQAMIDRKGLELAFQPKFRSSGALAGAEVLVRWPNAVAPWQQPEQFVRLAEQQRMSAALDLHVLSQAITQLKSLPEKTRAHVAPVSVNVSAVSVLEEGFIGSVKQVLASNQFPRLTLELTETAPLKCILRASKVFSSLARYGVSLSIDDFLHGHNDLEVLAGLPAREVKIDRKDVSSLHQRSTFQRVSAIITIAKQRNLLVTAEGVENHGQWSLLRSMGCDFCQGFWLAPPMKIRELGSFVENYSAPDRNEALSDLRRLASL